MIKMVEMSVLLGIKSHGQGTGHKKRARMPRVPSANSAISKSGDRFCRTNAFVCPEIARSIYPGAYDLFAKPPAL
jgi:hypothetical protein